MFPGSIIPDWIRYQSSESQIEVEVPPNWCANLLGFAFAAVSAGESPAYDYLKYPYIRLDLYESKAMYYYPVYLQLDSVVNYDEMESDHVFLTFAPLPPSVDWHQLIRVVDTFSSSCSKDYEIKRCGFTPIYANGEVNSLFSSSPANKSTIILREKIHAGETIEGENSWGTTYFTRKSLLLTKWKREGR